MRAPTSNLDVAGITAEVISARLLDALAQGMVLLERKVNGGTGIEARRLVQTWVAVRPVIANGIVTALVEDEGTAAVNRVGRLRYGLRPANIDKRLLRQICKDVHWLGPHGAQKVIESGSGRPVDLWSQLLPSAVNHIPAHDGRPAQTVGVGSDPERALKELSRGDGQAIAAMFEGLHLVDVAEVVSGQTSRSERRTWRPMRPVMGEDGVPTGYEVDPRVMRHTVNSGRNGFSPATYAAISPLLVEAGYDPKDGDMGHAYRLSKRWADAARDAIGWVPETGGDENEAEEPAASGDVEPAPVAPTARQVAILDMLSGREHASEGEPPTRLEVGEAIASHGGDVGRMAELIAAAMARAASHAKGAAAMDTPSAQRWWRR